MIMKMIGEMIFIMVNDEQRKAVYSLINTSSNNELKVIRVKEKNALKRKLEPYRSISAIEYLKEKCETNKLFSCYA